MKSKNKKVVMIIGIVIIGCFLLVVKIITSQKTEKYTLEEIYQYGEKIEKMDLLPNTIVAKFNGEEILFCEIESYRNSINYSIENGSADSEEKSAFYEVLKNKLYAQLAKKYPEASNYNLNIENNLQRTKNEWENGYGEEEVEEYREKWLKVLGIEKNEVWLNESDFVTYLQAKSIEDMLTYKGMQIIFDFIFEKTELAKDEELEIKIKQLQEMQETQNKLVNETDTEKRKEIIESVKDFQKLHTEVREKYVEDLVLNSTLELWVEKDELSYTVPEIYSMP